MRYYTRPEASNANNAKKFRRKTEADVLAHFDRLIAMLDNPPTEALRVAIKRPAFTPDLNSQKPSE